LFFNYHTSCGFKNCCIFTSSVLNHFATFSKYFKPIKIKLYENLYDEIDESTVGGKIYKLRKSVNLTKLELAKLLNTDAVTVERWELGIHPPKPSYIKDICSIFNLPLEYFHEYYYFYYISPKPQILKWMKENNLSNYKLSKLTELGESSIGRYFNGKINLTYGFYTTFKNLGAI